MRAHELLTEAKNVHMQHLEDLLLDDGYKGAVEALNYADSIREMLAKGEGQKGKISVKWDGSPAIFCGTDQNDGKFFVGTKAVLSKKPKYIKSPADVKKYYEDQPELGSKLLAAYKFLRTLGISGVLQGDLMFTDDDVKKEIIDGEEYLTFTPNTITYATPANSDFAKTISRAKIGVVFHTAHEPGESLRDTGLSFGVDLSELRRNPDVWFDDATYKDYTGYVSLTPEEDKKLRLDLKAAKRTLKGLGKQSIDKITNDPDFKANLQPFINARVREGQQIGNVEEFVNDFLTYFSELKKKGIETLSPKFQQKRLEKIEKKRQFVRENLHEIYSVIRLYADLVSIKLILVKKLNEINHVKTFIRTENGYEVTNQEGFVAIGHSGGAVKLVDRLEFSKQNFMRR